MNFSHLIRNFQFLSEAKRLELFPPFWFMGVKVLAVASDYRHVHLRLPLRWYGKNLYGSMFGGFICAVADPIPTLLCHKIFPYTDVWTKKQCVYFLKPARGDLDLFIDINEETIDWMSKQLATGGATDHEFVFYFRDRRGRSIARVENTIFIRNRAGQRAASSEPSPDGKKVSSSTV